jgi:hypothetical protein
MRILHHEYYHGPLERVPSQLDRVLPRYEFEGRAERIVFAPPRAVFQALYEVTLGEMPLAAFFGNLRYVPGRLLGRRPPSDSHRPFFEAADMKPLLEVPDREVIFASIGRLHDLTDQQFVPITDVASFERFSHPDYQKLAISIRVERTAQPYADRLIMEHRTLPLGAPARWKFALYWWLLIKWASDFMGGLLLDAVVRRAERSLASNVLQPAA